MHSEKQYIQYKPQQANKKKMCVHWREESGRMKSKNAKWQQIFILILVVQSIYARATYEWNVKWFQYDQTN